MISELLMFWSVMLFVLYVMKQGRMLVRGYQIPGPRGYPIVGNALTFWGKPSVVFKRLHEICRKYRRLVGFWIGPKLCVALYDARDVEVVLRASRIMDKADEYKFLRPWLGDSILLSKGNKFRKNKKIIMPNFHTNILKNYLEVFNEHAQRFVVNVGRETENEEFDVQNYFYLSMLSILLETSMGVSHKTLTSNGLVQYAHAVSKLCKVSHIRSYTLWLRFDAVFACSHLKKEQRKALDTVHPLTRKVIKRRKEELLSDQADQCNIDDIKKKRILLDLLLEAGKYGEGMTDQEIMDEVLTMMFAGQDTTSVSLGFTLSLLGIYKHAQERVQEELQEIFGGSDRPASYDDLQKMEYLERVIQETWRLYPPIPMIARTPSQDLTLETCTLPRSCTVAILIMLLHRNPEYFEHPHRFNPDNFLPEKVKNRHPYCFIPFSAGARTCVGSKYAMLNIKVMLSTILRNYFVHSKREEKDFVLVGQTTLKRKEGFLVCLKRKEDAPHLKNSTEKNNNLKFAVQDNFTNETIQNNNNQTNFNNANIKRNNR